MYFPTIQPKLLENFTTISNVNCRLSRDPHKYKHFVLYCNMKYENSVVDRPWNTVSNITLDIQS